MQSEHRESILRTGCSLSTERAVLGQGVQSEDRECGLRLGSAV